MKYNKLKKNVKVNFKSFLQMVRKYTMMRCEKGVNNFVIICVIHYKWVLIYKKTDF